jgi:hypothetical protein
MNDVRFADMLIERLFKDVVNKGGQPYVQHCRRVALKLTSILENVSDDVYKIDKNIVIDWLDKVKKDEMD